MPNKDKTGPTGKGPRTGRGMGNCAKDVNATQQPFNGRGLGRGMGRRQNNK